MQLHRGSLWIMSDFDFQKHLYLGTREDRDIALTHEDRLRHLYCVGQTGTGKSTFLLNLIAQDLAMDRGCALLDPHGDLAVAAIEQIPRHRAGHLVYFNPADLSRPIGFNLLARVPEDLRPLVADGVVSAFRHVWPDFWGPRLEHILANAVRTLMDVPDATLLCLPRLLQDDGYRAKLLPHLTDPVVRAFWTFEYDAYPPRFREEAIAPVLNKIGQVLRTPAIRNIIAQPKSTIDLRFMMDEKRILIANLSKGAIGEGPSHLLGALLVTALAQAALSRTDTTERPPFHLYVDEFQNFASESFALILSEARKYGLPMVLSHQYLEQLPRPLRDAVFGNIGSLAAFRCGAQDAPLLASQLDLRNPQGLKDLPNFAAWVSLLYDGSPTQAFRLAPYPPPEPANTRIEKMIENAAMHFGRDRSRVEYRINRFFDLP